MDYAINMARLCIRSLVGVRKTLTEVKPATAEDARMLARCEVALDRIADEMAAAREAMIEHSPNRKQLMLDRRDHAIGDAELAIKENKLELALDYLRWSRAPLGMSFDECKSSYHNERLGRDAA